MPGDWGGASAPLTRAKPLFFGQKLNFSDRNQQPKLKQVYFLYLLNEKMEFILSGETKCPKSAFLLIITGWDESGKVIL